MKRFAIALGVAVVSAPLVGGMVACSSTEHVAEADVPRLDLSGSRKNMLVGETMTIVAESKNLVGRDAAIRWSATQGRLDVERNGRIARFTPDHPGSAIITAEVNTGDGHILRDSREVLVQELRH
jgi:hypothetical protein